MNADSTSLWAHIGLLTNKQDYKETPVSAGSGRQLSLPIFTLVGYDRLSDSQEQMTPIQHPFFTTLHLLTPLTYTHSHIWSHSVLSQFILILIIIRLNIWCQHMSVAMFLSSCHLFIFSLFFNFLNYPLHVMFWGKKTSDVAMAEFLQWTVTGFGCFFPPVHT